MNRRVETCPVCGYAELEPLDLGGGTKLQRCSGCGTVSATEYADPEEVYREGYFFGETEYGLGTDPTLRLDVRSERFQEFLARVAERRMAMIEAAAGAPGAILDVGCGTGEVLAVARDRGWRAQGVEPQDSAAELARERGLDVRTGRLEESGLVGGRFDVACAFHVLEHLPDPIAFLRGLARAARPAGLVAVEVPNFSSLDRRRTGAAWRGIRPGEHITHFTPATLRRALRSAGLDVVALRAPTWAEPPQAPYDALAGFGLGPSPDKALAKSLRRRKSPRALEVAGWGAIRALDRICDRAGLGMNIVGIARRTIGRHAS